MARGDNKEESNNPGLDRAGAQNAERLANSLGDAKESIGDIVKGL